jgi:uncharacterized protein
MAHAPLSPIPSAGTGVRDLTDAEFAELDDLLAATPEPLEPLDAVMLDGYLCGVLVQPVLLGPEQWLPPIFDVDGRPLPPDHDPAWHARAVELITRRCQALNRSLVEDGWFDPLVLEEADPAQDTAAAAAAAADTASDGPPDAARPVAAPAADEQGLSPISQALLPWVAGFQCATEWFPELMASTDDGVSLALARLFRHLPAETEEERELLATLDREQPLATLDEAVEELVMCVADLADLTREARYRVETIQRSGPKTGRNDPCPCGSGRKFKACHGR